MSLRVKGVDECVPMAPKSGVVVDLGCPKKSSGGA